jgi:uncharacterized protein YecE (DUF72 family)
MYPVRIGTAGWSIPTHFTAEAPTPTTGTHLERYARTLPSVEINSSFYRPHRPSTWTKWAACVPASFRFSVKAPKTITHEAHLACTPDQLKTFLDAVFHLGEKLGPILFQLPPKSPFNPAVAETFLTMYRHIHSGPTVFEPRHPTWFTPQAEALLERFHIARAAVDPAAVPAASTPGGTSDLIYHRLHGSPRIYYSDYPTPFLKALAVTITHQRNTAEVWCIFDNTAAGAAFGNALTLQQLLS